MTRGAPPAGGPDALGLLEQILSTLTSLPSALRQLDADALWAKIPVDVEEIGSHPLISAVGNVVMPARAVNGLWLCTSVVAVLPAGAAGTVTLGSLQLPVGAGLTSITGKRFLSGSDARSLTVTTAPAQPGYAALWLCGEQRPTFGAL